MKRLVLLTVLATALLAAGAATAIATPGSVLGNSSAKQSAGAAMGSVSVRFKINKFVKRGHRLIAKGNAIATYTPQSGGAPTVVKKPFSARVTVAGRLFGTQAQQTICPVLALQLDQLSLDLLGLTSTAHSSGLSTRESATRYRQTTRRRWRPGRARSSISSSGRSTSTCSD